MRARLAAWVTAALALMVVVAGCASVPSSGPVMFRQAEQNDEDAVGYIPPAPQTDADPESLVRSFLLAGGSGSTAATQYETAELYLADDVRDDWTPTGNVVVYLGSPEITVRNDDADTARVTVSVEAAAHVDAHGTFTEASNAAPFTTSFSLTRGEDEQWRIDELEDGVLVPSRQFANQFKATQLFFPSLDKQTWVPEQRWFPRSSWRTSAVAEALAGPPDWLQGAVGTAVEEGTQLAVPTVTDDDEGAIVVQLGEEVLDLDDARLALLFAQLKATLADGGLQPEIALYAGDSRLTEPTVDQPVKATTRGMPIALSGGELYTVSDERLTDFERSVHLEELAPTAIAVGPGAAPVVVRDGRGRLVRVADVDTVGGQQELLVRERLAEPSVDRYGYVWTSDDLGRDFDPEDDDGRLLVVHESGEQYTVTADWLNGRQVIGVRVAPDGVRVAVVSRTAGSTSVHVAAIVRGDEDEPALRLATGVEVAAGVPDVVSAQWSDQTALFLLARDDDGVTTMYETGVGGLPDESGSTVVVQELASVRSLTSGVTDAGALALTRRGDLYQEHTTGWGDPVAENIDSVAYPG
ncbi:LpqB family beta-propeller domain-containing protein [Myceligenerans cantabricum]